MFKVVLIAALAVCVFGEPVPGPKTRCDLKHPLAGLSAKYWETIAHAIHSLDVENLRKFEKSAGVDNHIPTVNLNLKALKKVLDDAPLLPLGHDFHTEEMNVIDRILSLIGKSDDGLGANWTPLERIVHNFHMRDLWALLKPVYDSVKVDKETCDCLLDVADSGVKGAVGWVANHYAHGTPITLLNRPIPVLTDANTWKLWKNRLLNYYTAEARHDAAYYLKCAL